MKQLNYFFYYAYAGLALLAGFWGAFGSPRLDFRILFHFSPDRLGAYARINLLDQYRFLRALEFGFGLYCFLFVREVFRNRKFNALFLVTMASATVARIVSFLAEGMPSAAMCFFLAFEATGFVVISLYSFQMLYHKQLSHG
jgi:hypothetical protein